MRLARSVVPEEIGHFLKERLERAASFKVVDEDDAGFSVMSPPGFEGPTFTGITGSHVPAR